VRVEPGGRFARDVAVGLARLGRRKGRVAPAESTTIEKKSPNDAYSIRRMLESEIVPLAISSLNSSASTIF
jgi:hypothetical protein